MLAAKLYLVHTVGLFVRSGKYNTLRADFALKLRQFCAWYSACNRFCTRSLYF